MNAIVEISNDRATLWNEFVDNFDGASFYHRYEWREFFAQALGKETIYLASLTDDSVINGVLPIVRQKSRLFGDYGVSLPFLNYGGTLATNAVVKQALVTQASEVAKRWGISHLEFRDAVPMEGLPARTDKVAMVLDLPDSEEALGKSLGSKRRSQIRRPQRENPSVRVGGAELLDGFYKVFARNMRDLGTPVYGKSFFADILRLFPEESSIVYIEIGGAPAAAGFVFNHRGNAEIPWASTVSDFNKISINMLLYWEVLRHLIASKAKTFDFGRSTVDSGTFRFKKQWGAEPKQLYWHYWLRDGGEPPKINPDNAKYQLAIKAWQRLPLGVANFLGPRIVTHLP